MDRGRVKYGEMDADIANALREERKRVLESSEIKELIRLVMKNCSRFDTEDALKSFDEFRRRETE